MYKFILLPSPEFDHSSTQYLLEHILICNFISLPSKKKIMHERILK